MEQTLYVLRSKRTGWYFKFEQYADDGWGMFEDNVTAPFNGSDMPYLFSHYEMFETDKSYSHPWCVLHAHTADEVEVVKVTLTFED